MKEIIENKKKLILNAIFILLILFITSIISFVILMAFGVVSFENGIEFNTKLFESFTNSPAGWIIFILFQTLLTMFLSAIPGVSMAFIILSTKLFTNSWEAFLVSFISVMISSFVMFLIGKYGGHKVCEKILGKEDCDKSLKLLSNKGTVYFPVMMMLPVFPDDALVMIAGTINMKLRWFIPSIIIGRGVGIATIVFGFSLIPFDSFTTLYDWIVFITVCLVWMEILFKFTNKISKKVEEKANQE